MPHVPHQLVSRAVEHPVERYSQFDGAQVGGKMAARTRNGRQQFRADLRGNLLQLLGSQRPQVSRTLDLIEQAGHVSSCVWGAMEVYQLVSRGAHRPLADARA